MLVEEISAAVGGGDQVGECGQIGSSEPDGGISGNPPSWVDQAPQVWLTMSSEFHAEALTELAEEFDREARQGGKCAAGLAMAATVLRDRAAETGVGTPSTGL